MFECLSRAPGRSQRSEDTSHNSLHDSITHADKQSLPLFRRAAIRFPQSGRPGPNAAANRRAVTGTSRGADDVSGMALVDCRRCFVGDDPAEHAYAAAAPVCGENNKAYGKA